MTELTEDEVRILGELDQLREVEFQEDLRTMTDELEERTYGTASIYITEGMYTKKEVLEFLDYFLLMEKRQKELLKDIREGHEHDT